MKVTAAFLILAISCCIGSGFTLYTAPGSPAKKEELPTIPKQCLQKLLMQDVPDTLTTLKDLLCLYEQGKKEKNEELIREFLERLHTTLIDAGCTVDEILSLEEFLEKVGDQVGEVAKDLVEQILKLADELNILGLLSGALCDLLGEPLGNLADVLGGKGNSKGSLIGGLLGK